MQCFLTQLNEPRIKEGKTCTHYNATNVRSTSEEKPEKQPKECFISMDYMTSVLKEPLHIKSLGRENWDTNIIIPHTVRNSLLLLILKSINEKIRNENSGDYNEEVDKNFADVEEFNFKHNVRVTEQKPVSAVYCSCE